MAACDHLEHCRFFTEQMSMDEGIGAMYREKYCDGDFSACARYRVGMALGCASVPSGLYPNMQKQADKILAGGKA